MGVGDLFKRNEVVQKANDVIGNVVERLSHRESFVLSVAEA